MEDELILQAYYRDNYEDFSNLFPKVSYDVLQEIFTRAISLKQWNFIKLFNGSTHRFHYLLDFYDYNFSEIVLLNILTKNVKTDYLSFYMFRYLIERRTPFHLICDFLNLQNRNFFRLFLRIFELSLHELLYILQELPSLAKHCQEEFLTILYERTELEYHSDLFVSYVKLMMMMYDSRAVVSTIERVLSHCYMFNGGKVCYELLEKIKECGIEFSDVKQLDLNMQNLQL